MKIGVAEDGRDRDACLQLRRTVFIEEQGVPEAEEVDGLDHDCLHILAREGNVPVGTARIRLIDGIAKVQRVCVPAEYRGRRIGSKIMTFAVDLMKQDQRARVVRLGSQTHALEFYRKLGFREVSGEYLDAGIPHRDMELPLRDGAS